MKYILKLFVFAIMLLFSIHIVNAYPFEYEVCNLGWQHIHHEHSEESYQKAWCDLHGGISEYENKDKCFNSNCKCKTTP